jgi:uncharacterized membrane protein
MVKRNTKGGREAATFLSYIVQVFLLYSFMAKEVLRVRTQAFQ